MRILAAVMTVLLVSSSVLPTGAVANEPPLADAGLDQTVARGTTVFLDASGSRDPDGEIAGYDWSIRTPGNGTATPACATCARTEFTPDQVGEYAVTVTVTDDDGATVRDTLYVVVEPGDPPAIGVAGPETTSTGTSLSYTATVEAGTASLAEIEWSVDGQPVRTEPINASQRRFALPYTFESAGRHDVVATVTDADGLTATDSLTVQVDARNASGGGGGGNGSGNATPGGGGPSLPSTIASRRSPVVRGPDLLTGERPLAASYRLDVAARELRSVTWWRDGHRAGSGTNERPTWEPGTHYLYAVVEYTDGSTDTARFPDGTTDIEADPKPTVSLARSGGFGSLTGILEATDGFGNLRAVSVTVDGTEVVSKTVDPLAIRAGDAGESLDLSFEYSDIRPGEKHEVVLEARDARGQKATVTRMVEAVGEPEIIRSEFVNGPVDSYHDRIDPERYTAHHVLEIKLNGVDAGLIETSFESNRLTKAGERNWKRKKTNDVSGGTLTVETDWKTNSPGSYVLGMTTRVGDPQKSDLEKRALSIIDVTPSPPEARINVSSDGTPDDAKDDWGLVVNASRSFDPDRTSLDYIWLGRAKAITEDSPVGKFDSFDINALRVQDGNDQTTTVSGPEILRHYAPEPRSVEELSTGPYKPRETVRFRIRTAEFKLPKQIYYDHTPIDVRIEDSRGRVSDWGCSVVGPFDEAIMNQHDWHCEIERTAADPNRRGNHYFAGNVSFRAEELSEADTLNLTVFNRNTPNRSTRNVSLPDVTVLTKGKRFVSNVTVLNTSYLVEEPVVTRQETTLSSQRDAYIEDGFTIETTEQSGTNYTIEKRVQTREAIYDTKKRTFADRGLRNAFLGQHPEWKPGETISELRNTTTVQYDWRDTKGGSGTFTGSTRRVKTDEADYRTQREFRHEYTVERTGTRTVTRTRTVRVPVTRTRTETNCNPLGCWDHTVTYTVWVTRTTTYTTTETYTYTTTETSTYWAISRRNPDDARTGRTRRKKVDSADYRTQYRYRTEETTQELVYRYTATYQKLVQPAEYEWRFERTTTSDLVAESAELSADRRIASTKPATRWILTKQTGTNRTWTAVIDDPTQVVQTEATVNETISQRYIHPTALKTVSEEEKFRITVRQFEDYQTEETIRKKLNRSRYHA